jgi:hypothetical protein
MNHFLKGVVKMKAISENGLERKISKTCIPYPEIIAAAIKTGWKVLFDDTEGEKRTVKIVHPLSNRGWETAYLLSEPGNAFYNIYDW